MVYVPDEGVVPPFSDDLEVIRLLKQTNHSHVYLAQENRKQRLVIVKQLHKQWHGSKAKVERFQFETDLQSRLYFQGIPRVYDFGVIDTLPYIVMEYVAGESLLTLIEQFHSDRRLAKESMHPDARHDPNLRRLLEAFRDLCRIAHRLAGKGVFHSDIKPQHAMVIDTRDVFLLDFGSAIYRPRDGASLGDLPAQPYSPPDRTASYVPSWVYLFHNAEGQKATPSWKDLEEAAVFELGATLFHILANRAPYDTRALAAGDSFIRDSAVPPRLENDSFEIPIALRRIAIRAMAHSPNERHRTPGEVAAEIQAWLDDLPIPSAPDSPAEEEERQARRDPEMYRRLKNSNLRLSEQQNLLARRNKALKYALSVLLVFSIGLVVASTFAFISQARSDAAETKALKRSQEFLGLLNFVTEDLLSPTAPAGNLRERLRIAIANIEAKLGTARSPELNARMYKSIGNFLSRAGFYADASEAFGKSAEIFLHLDRKEYANAQCCQGVALNMDGFALRGVEALRAGLDEFRIHSEDREQYVAFERDLATAFFKVGDFSSARRALAAFESTLAAMPTELPTSRELKTDASICNAALYLAEGHDGQAAEALELARTRGPSAVQRAAMVDIETGIAQRAGRSVDAAQALQLALLDVASVDGLMHPVSLQLAARLALAHAQSGSLEDESEIAEYLEKAEALYGNSAQCVLILSAARANFLRFRGNFGGAIVLDRRIEGAIKLQLGANSPMALRAQLNTVESLASLNRSEELLADASRLRDRIAMNNRKLNSFECVGMMLRIGYAFLRAGNRIEARSSIDAAMRIAGSDKHLIAKCQLYLCYLLLPFKSTGEEESVGSRAAHAAAANRAISLLLPYVDFFLPDEQAELVTFLSRCYGIAGDSARAIEVLNGFLGPKKKRTELFYLVAEQYFVQREKSTARPPIILSYEDLVGTYCSCTRRVGPLHENAIYMARLAVQEARSTIDREKVLKAIDLHFSNWCQQCSLVQRNSLLQLCLSAFGLDCCYDALGQHQSRLILWNNAMDVCRRIAEPNSAEYGFCLARRGMVLCMHFKEPSAFADIEEGLRDMNNRVFPRFRDYLPDIIAELERLKKAHKKGQ